MDQEYWDNEHRLQQERKQKRLAYEQDLIGQINAKRQEKSPEQKQLDINKDYIVNIKQIKDLLTKEINEKSKEVQPRIRERRHLGQGQGSVSVVGLANSHANSP